jgi:hypothetical protein
MYMLLGGIQGTPNTWLFANTAKPRMAHDTYLHDSWVIPVVPVQLIRCHLHEGHAALQTWGCFFGGGGGGEEVFMWEEGGKGVGGGGGGESAQQVS